MIISLQPSQIKIFFLKKKSIWIHQEDEQLYKPVLKRDRHWKKNIAEKGYYSADVRHRKEKHKLCKFAFERHKGYLWSGEKVGKNLTFQKMFGLTSPLYHYKFVFLMETVNSLLSSLEFIWGFGKLPFPIMYAHVTGKQNERDIWVPEMTIQLHFTIIPESTVFEALGQKITSNTHQTLGGHICRHEKPGMFHIES